MLGRGDDDVEPAGHEPNASAGGAGAPPDPTAGSPQDIVAAVLRCPSGALHFTRHDGGAEERPDVPASVTPVPDGPLYLRGELEIRAAEGTPVRRDTRAAVCRCGHATKLPLCDNTCRALGWRG